MEIEEQLQQPIFPRLKQNVDQIDALLGSASDLVKRDFIIVMQQQELDATLLFIDGMADDKMIEHSILRPLLHNPVSTELSADLSVAEIKKYLTKKGLHVPSISTISTFKEGIDEILAGHTLLLIDQCEFAIALPVQGWETRGVEEPQSETVIKGPRDGFVESLRTNTALVRRRIRDPQFRVQSMQIGTRSKTDIAITYIDDLVREGLVDEVLERLSRIDIDAVLESNYIEEFIDDATQSPFLTVQGTERPDKIAAGMYEGKVAIFVDNSPYVLLVPAQFYTFLQASDDYYTPYLSSSYIRLFRYAAFIISLTLPSFFVMLVNFHQEMIPTQLAITIAAGREIVPLPILLEALIMEFAFELIRESGIRMPKAVGQAVSIVGSLIIGQAAVEAGVVSPIMVIIVALTGIASFAIPNYQTSMSIRLLRFPILIASGFFGLLGFATIFVFLVIHALSLRSFGEPYMAPVFPFNTQDQQDTIMRRPFWAMNKRPADVKTNSIREAENQKPSPKQGRRRRRRKR